ncbi:symmetrical bis(5'-nucleosyl)-tetraphosphatase [soil metagenome]
MIVAIGDLQGCRAPLEQLIDRIEADLPDAKLWFCGDLVNRGPDSLGTLRLVRSLGDRAISVLGNHDLHLLGVACGQRKLRPGDTLDDILAAPDRDELLDWLRHRPLAHFEAGHLLVHAGVLPQWTIQQAIAHAREVEARLAGPNWADLLAGLFGHPPVEWHDDLLGIERWRGIVDAFTRIRFCTLDGQLDLRANGRPDEPPAGHRPWFEVPARQTIGTTVVFGHWSALGLMMKTDLIALDSGCVWGNALTGVGLADAPEHRRIWQVPCAHSEQKAA